MHGVMRQHELGLHQRQVFDVSRVVIKITRISPGGAHTAITRTGFELQVHDQGAEKRLIQN